MIIEELKEFESEQKGDTLVFSNVPNPVYHAGVGVSSSKIRAFGKSQLHAVERVQEPPPAMNFGTAAHALRVEGEEAFNQTVAVVMGSPYTNANKDLKREYEERGLTVIKESEMTAIKGMKEHMIEEGNIYLNAEGKVVSASSKPIPRQRHMCSGLQDHSIM
jgi:hypothetical protein